MEPQTTPQAPPPQVQPTSPQPAPPTPVPAPIPAPLPTMPTKSNKRRNIIIGVILAVLIVGGVTGYMLLGRSKGYSLKKECRAAYDLGVDADFYQQISKFYAQYKDVPSLATYANACDSTTLKSLMEEYPTAEARQKLLEELKTFSAMTSPSEAAKGFEETKTKARDVERKVDTNAIATTLEVYFTENYGYPTIDKLNQASSALPSVDAEAYIAPDQTTNSYVDTATPTKDQYGYKVFEADGKTPCKKDTCPKYVLYYFSETENAVKTKTSLN